MKQIITILCVFFFIQMGFAQQTKEELLRQIRITEAAIKAEKEKQAAIKAEKEKEKQKEFYNSKKSRQICSNITTVYTEFKPVSNEEFITLCNTPLQNLAEFQKQNPAIDYNISYSCYRDKEKTVQNFCFEAIDVEGFNKVIIRNHEESYYNPSSQKIEQETVNLISADVQQKLEKISNTKKMYQDLIVALDNELWYNTVEIADNASNLLVKHVPVGTDEMQQIQKRAIEKLRNSTGVTAPSIDNKTADVVNSVIDNAEMIVELIPDGDVITNHYLWKLFKSTPEAGKILGHVGTEINIYFRKNEYHKKIEALEQEEQRLLNINNKQ